MKEIKEMIKENPTLGVFLDIDKLDKLTQKFNTASYGFVGWKIIWKALNVQNLKGVTYLFDGDTNGTLNGYERIWCAAFQSDNKQNLSYIRSSLENNSEFKDITAPTKFKEDNSVTGEPLLGSGCIISKGRWKGKTEFDSYRALVSSGFVSSKKWWYFWK
jgi:hypothetical protein